MLLVLCNAVWEAGDAREGGRSPSSARRSLGDVWAAAFNKWMLAHTQNMGEYRNEIMQIPKVLSHTHTHNRHGCVLKQS